MRRAPKRDANEAAVIALLRAVGCSVQQLDCGGAPDLLVGYRGQNYLMEVKTPGERLNALQKSWHSEWRGRAHVVWSPEDAQKVIVYWGGK